MIALVLEIGPRLGLVALLAVAIVTYGGYMARGAASGGAAATAFVLATAMTKP